MLYHSTEYVVITGTNCDVNWDLGKTGQLDEKRHDLENAKDKCAEVSVKSLNPSFVLCLVTTH